MKDNKTIYLIDMPMSCGKTTAIFNWMKAYHNKDALQKFLYISPMLSEVEDRVPLECGEMDFHFPNTEVGSKSSDLTTLLRQGKNICCTHSLFTLMTKEHLELIRKQEYILIIDEEPNLFEAYAGGYKKGDIESLEKRGLVRVNEEEKGRVEWLWDDMEPNTVYSRLKRMCELSQLHCAKRSRDMLVVHLPIDLVTSSKHTILITYKFRDSLLYHYIRMKGIEIEPIESLIPDIQYVKTEQQFLEEAKSLITIAETPSTKKIKKWSLSATWYTNCSRDKRQAIGKAIHSIAVKHGGYKNIVYTMPKDCTIKSGKGSGMCCLRKDANLDSFLYSKARATNEYSHVNTMVHAYNRYCNLQCLSYMQDYYGEYLPDNINDVTAISELIQWVWRSAIRNGEPITLYFLSERMERLFIEWLENTTKDTKMC